jgi:hypothetical protein
MIGDRISFYEARYQKNPRTFDPQVEIVTAHIRTLIMAMITTLEGLANQVQVQALTLNKLLAEANLPSPLFAPDAPPAPPPTEKNSRRFKRLAWL